jgi:hypothetical protein
MSDQKTPTLLSTLATDGAQCGDSLRYGADGPYWGPTPQRVKDAAEAMRVILESLPAGERDEAIGLVAGDRWERRNFDDEPKIGFSSL